MKAVSLDELSGHLLSGTATELTALLPDGIRQEVGHFNVFDLADLSPNGKPAAGYPPYPCRAYYKISLMRGHSRIQYADKIIETKGDVLLFSAPKGPYYWHPLTPPAGQFCVFTAEFLLPTKSGVMLDELPIFRMDAKPVFVLTGGEYAKAAAIFNNLHEEIRSDYAYKYDLLRNYVLELIHLGQKLQPASVLHPAHHASARITAQFIELLERQFPLETPRQRLQMRSAKDYADHLAVHINHLNRVLKETTGLTTTRLIEERIAQEAKALLKQTDWTIAQIAGSLGFADVAHFSHFFKRQTAMAPGSFRT